MSQVTVTVPKTVEEAPLEYHTVQATKFSQAFPVSSRPLHGLGYRSYSPHVLT